MRQKMALYITFKEHQNEKITLLLLNNQNPFNSPGE